MTQTQLDPMASFASIDKKLVQLGPSRRATVLSMFRDRLIGELLGDTARVLTPLTPDFTLVNRSAGVPESVLDLPAFKTSFEQAARYGVMIWGDWDHIVVDDDTLVLEGAMSTLRPGPPAEDGTDSFVHSVFGAVVMVIFEGEQIASEVLIAEPGAPVITAFPAAVAPARDQLAELLGVSLPG